MRSALRCCDRCLCKPKIKPLKSAALMRLEAQEQVAAHVGQEAQEEEAAYAQEDDDRTKEGDHK